MAGNFTSYNKMLAFINNSVEFSIITELNVWRAICCKSRCAQTFFLYRQFRTLYMPAKIYRWEETVMKI